jgi:glycosyltransferase 2 family protein
MKRGVRTAAGILLTAACLYFAFKDVQWNDAVRSARDANYPLLLLSAAIATMMFPLRARRWRTILDPVAPKLPFGPLWRATTIGMMVNNVLPARAGEFARAYVITREVPAITFPMSLASLVVDRVFDAIVVFLLLIVAIASPSFPAGVTIKGQSIGHIAAVFSLAPLGLLIILYLLAAYPKTLIRAFELVARRVSSTLETRGSEMLHRFAGGLSVLRAPGHFVAVLWWALLLWVVQPVAFWLGLRAFGIDVPWSATLLVQALTVIGVSLPSTPGYFGLFEAAAVLALKLYGVGETPAATWALVYHVVSLIPITLIGAYYFARAGISVRDINSSVVGDKS